jgi:hypothetical protein
LIFIFVVSFKTDEIDWGDFSGETIQISESALCDVNIEQLKNEISVEEVGVYIPSDGVAKGDDARYILEWPETRHLFLDDLVKVCVGLKKKKFLFYFSSSFFCFFFC